MKSKAINWLREKLRRARKPQPVEEEIEDGEVEDDVTNLPRLPSVRPRVLTPSPSSEALVSTGSPFFEKLPRELRRHILLKAFGDGLVHMDLSFKPPDIPQETEPRFPSHAGINADQVYGHSWTTLGDAGPKSWQWWGSVCHSVLPPHIRLADMGRYKAGYRELATDFCRYGQAIFCEIWPGSHPSKCNIGVMGWLLSCRQAYVEGIEVLYRTNTIHMSGHALILNLPQLLLPQRLSNITSLEIVCPLKTLGPLDRRTLRVGRLNNYLAALSSNVPNLARLHLAIQVDWYAPSASMPKVLEALDAFVLGTGLASLTVSISTNFYKELYMPIREDLIAKHNHQEWNLSSDLWRNLDGSYVLPFHGRYVKGFRKMAASWPEPPQAGHNAIGAETGDGYWLVEGDDNDLPPYRCVLLG